MSIRVIATSINRMLSRTLHRTAPACGLDARDKRAGHMKKKDKIDGEYGSFEASQSSYELVDENLLDKVFEHTKFKDLPVIHIICTRNNTKIAIIKGNGDPCVTKTTGTEGFKNCRKGTTVAAQAVANRIVTYAHDHDIKMARLIFNGLGPGRGAAFKVIELSGIKIVSLTDKTSAVEPWIQRPRAAKSI